ncbi:hypothetical protein ACNFG0_09710 [Pseudomonas sp. NY15372]|uniref:hypothetical protein n=1 Tax=Pseudomonas sp. NY15372 TaxID=3400356 RepID=UPI003A88D5C5
MSNNMFMAGSTTVLNAAALTITSLFPNHNVAQVVMALCSLVSPFLSIWLLKLYIRSDDPPELTRSIAGLKASIKTCEGHLKDKGASPEFKESTRLQLEDFKKKLQNVRPDFEKGRVHTITPFQSSHSDPPG